MANNEIKVTIKADNKQFLTAIDEVTGAVKKLNNLKTEDVDIVLSKADTVMRQIGYIGKALAGIANKTVNVAVDTTQAIIEIGKVQDAMSGISDKFVKIRSNSGQAVVELDKVKDELKKINEKKDIDIKVVGTPSGMIAGLIDKIRNTELSIPTKVAQQTEEPKGDFSKIIVSAKEFMKIINGVNKALKLVSNDINALNNKAIKIATSIKIPKLDESILRSEWFKNAIESANVFIEKLKLINTFIKQAVKNVSTVQLPHLSAPTISPNNQPRAPNKPSSEGTGGNNYGSEGFLNGFLGGLAKASAAVAGVMYLLVKVKDIAASIVMPGFNYTKEIETSQLGIAGILTSMTNLDGKAMDFASAMVISADMMKKLQKDAILTSATTEEMVTTFRALLAPGIGAGMNIDQIEEFTKIGVNAVKAMGLNSTQFVQELRDLVQGGIQASSSTLATSLGLTDADIKAAKASSEGLFEFLMNRMAGFAPMAEEFPKTLAGKMSMLKEFSTLASAKITEAFVPEIKAVLDLVTGFFGTINKEVGSFEVNPTILKFIDMIKFGASEVIEIFGQMNEKGQFEVNTEVIDFFDGLGEGISAVGDLLISIGNAIDTVFNNQSFSIVKDYWIPVLSDLWDIAIDIVDIFTGVITVIGNLADMFIKAQAPFQEFIANGVMWAIEKLKEFVNIAKLGWDMLVKLSGGVQIKDTGSKRNDWQQKSLDQEKQNKQRIDHASITAKYESRATIEAAKKADKERIKASQNTLKEMLKYWKNQLDDIQREFKKKQEALKLRLDQGKISKADSFQRSLQDDIAEKDRRIQVIDGQIKSTQGTEYEKLAEKQSVLNDLYRERDIATAEMNDLTKALNEMTVVIGKMNTMTPEQAIKKYGLNSADFDQSNSANTMYKYAQQAAAKIGVPSEWVYSQWGHESGNFKSQLAKENNNYGGLTQVENNGVENKQPDGDYYYMKFQSPEEYAEYFARYIKKYYPDAANAKTVEAYVSALKSGGYFGDDYGKYLSGVKAQMENITQLPVQSGAGEGKSWYKVTAENPKYDALEGNAKQALEQVASFFNKLTGEQMGLTSGKRSADLGYSGAEIGGHYTGMKFDVTAEALKDPAIRQKVIEFAKSIGIDVLDEYSNLTINASGKHLDFDAANFKAKSTIGRKEPDIGELQTRQAYEMYMARMEMREKAKGFLSQYQGLIGDISSYQIEDITKQYKMIRDELALYPSDDKAREALEVMNKLEASEKAKVYFAQTQKNLDYAKNELVDYQEALAKSVSDSSVSAKALMQAYIDRFHAQTDKYRDDLEAQLRQAADSGNIGQVNQIKAELKELTDGLQTGLENIIKAYDSELQMQIAEINANRKMTQMQKQDAIDTAQQRQYEIEADKAWSTADNYRATGDLQKAYNAEREGALYDNLAKLPTLLDRIHEASTQAFEDGLLDFLTRGIFECESLGEAFRNMAITILEAMQKVFAEDLTKNIMTGIGFGDKYAPPGSEQNTTGAESAALSGSFGAITTETNGFLVSFNGQMFQFAQQAQVAFQNILQTISSAANSIPSMGSMPFSFGGAGASSAGGGFDPNFGYDMNNIFGFAGGGEIDGPGTETSDSIFARLSRGEFVINAAAAKKVGTNFLHRVNSGDIYNLRIPMPKFAKGGSVGGIGANAAAQGMSMFSQDIGANVSPVINNNAIVRVDGGKLAGVVQGLIDTQVTSKIEREMTQNAKRNSMVMKKLR